MPFSCIQLKLWCILKIIIRFTKFENNIVDIYPICYWRCIPHPNKSSRRLLQEERNSFTNRCFTSNVCCHGNYWCHLWTSRCIWMNLLSLCRIICSTDCVTDQFLKRKTAVRTCSVVSFKIENGPYICLFLNVDLYFFYLILFLFTRSFLD